MEKLQEELETMQPLLAQAAEETVETMEKIKVDSVRIVMHNTTHNYISNTLVLVSKNLYFIRVQVYFFIMHCAASYKNPIKDFGFRLSVVFLAFPRMCLIIF